MKSKVFYMSDLRELLNKYAKAEISISFFLQELNVKAEVYAEQQIKELEEVLEKTRCENDEDMIGDGVFVSPVFGDNWKENAIKNYPIDIIADIALKQGRRAIELEKEIKELEEKLSELEIGLIETFGVKIMAEYYRKQALK